MKDIIFKIRSRAVPLLLPGVILLAFSLRLIYLFEIRSTPLFNFLAADSSDFDKFARMILEGDFFYRPSLYFNPFYPFFLSLIYFICGHHPLAVGIWQLALDSLNCLFLYLICRHIFRSRRVGYLAAFLYAGYGLAIFYTGIILGASLATFLGVVLLYSLVIAREKNHIRSWFAAGLIFGIWALLRPNVLLIFPVLLFWIGVVTRKGNLFPRLIKLLLPVAGVVLVFLPFCGRNYVMTGRFSPPFSNGGFNFYVGNHPGAKGTYIYLPGISNSPSGQIKSAIRKASRELGEKSNINGASNYWFHRGLDYARSQPLRFLFLQGKKLMLFFNSQEISQNVDYNFCRRFSALLKFPLFAFTLIASLAAVGFLRTARQKPAGISLPLLLFAGYLASVIIFFVSARYRLPAIPLLIIFSAYGLDGLIGLLRPLRLKPLLLNLAVLGVAAFLVKLDLAPYRQKEVLSWSHNILGNVYQEEGKPAAAIQEFQQALRIDPANINALNQLGGVHRKLGRPEEAMGFYRRALKIDPVNATSHNNLGVIYAEKGEIEAAFREFAHALRTNPDFGETHSNLAVYYLYYKNDIKRAVFHYQQALADGYQVPERLRRDITPSLPR